MLRGGVLLILIIVAFVGGGPPAEAKRIALVVGINKYDNLPERQQLQRAINDSESIARTLKELKFEVVNGVDATRQGFNSLWQRFLDQIDPEDTVTFYFAGHGVEIEGLNFLS